MKRTFALILSAIMLAVLIIGCKADENDGFVSPHDKITDTEAILPFLPNGNLIWEASDFTSLYIDFWQERSDFEGVFVETGNNTDIRKLIAILSNMRKTLIYTNELSGHFSLISEIGTVPDDSGDVYFHFGPTLPDRAFLQVLKTETCCHLSFRLENHEETQESYNSSMYCVSLDDYEKLESFLNALNKTPADLGGKPVLYLYPEYETDVSVKLDFDGMLSTTYPAYRNGWNVRAYPDGRLINYSDDQEYSYLFWEGYPRNANWNLDEGYCISGADTVTFLQEVLSGFGLLPREYNEFIVYWLPHMQNNRYNLITFQWEEFDRVAPLEIVPEPDSILRVFMVFMPLQYYVEIEPPPQRPVFAREGFTVVEWGALIMQ